MSWTDPSVSKGRQLTRRVYYLRGGTNVVNKSFIVNDQLPQGQLFRVSCTGTVSGTTTLTGTSVLEVRLYNAFSAPGINDLTSGGTTTAGVYYTGQSYILLGVCNSLIASAALHSWNFCPCPPVEVRGFQSANWTVVFFDVDKNAQTLNFADVGGWSLQVDVRGGGSAEYTN